MPEIFWSSVSKPLTHCSEQFFHYPDEVHAGETGLAHFHTLPTYQHLQFFFFLASSSAISCLSLSSAAFTSAWIC